MAIKNNYDVKKLKYSSNLRKMVMLINPHHFSCAYKQCLDDHCSQVLRNIDKQKTSKKSPSKIYHGYDEFAHKKAGLLDLNDRKSIEPGYTCCKSESSMFSYKPPVVNNYCEQPVKSQVKYLATRFPGSCSLQNAEDMNMYTTYYNQGRCKLPSDAAKYQAHDGSCNQSTSLDTKDSNHGFLRIISKRNRCQFKEREDMNAQDESNSDDEYKQEISKPSVPSLTEFYRSIANRTPSQLDHMGAGAWKVCEYPHSQDVDRNFLKAASSSSLPLYCGYLSSGIRPTTSERIPYGLSPFRRSPLLESASAGLTGTTHLQLDQKQATKRPFVKGKQRIQKNTELEDKFLSRSRKRKEEIRSKVSRRASDSPISYGFQHHNSHRGYMQHYRNDYTRKKLEHVLLQCAQRYQASKDTQLVPRAAVECNDVRQGACIQPDLFKEPEYKYEVYEKYLVAPDLSLGLPKRPLSPRPISACSQYSDSASICSTVSLTLCGTIPPRSTEKNDIEDSEAGSVARSWSRCGSASSERPCVKQTIVHKLPGRPGSSTSVNRSRPSIPCNSRGIVCATSVETPVHIVNKPYLPAARGRSITERVSSASRRSDMDKK